jgi:hypothetical protein
MRIAHRGSCASPDAIFGIRNGRGQLDIDAEIEPRDLTEPSGLSVE